MWKEEEHGSEPVYQNRYREASCDGSVDPCRGLSLLPAPC